MAAAWVARCRAALAFAFALAEAPFRRRRPPPGAGAVAGKGEVDPGEVGAGGSSSTSSFAFILPSPVMKNVREADPPAEVTSAAHLPFCVRNMNEENGRAQNTRPLRGEWGVCIWEVCNYLFSSTLKSICLRIVSSDRRTLRYQAPLLVYAAAKKFQSAQTHTALSAQLNTTQWKSNNITQLNINHTTQHNSCNTL